MQDEKIGEKCSICHRRDYIPFECKKCKKKLCDEHYWSEEHTCRFEGGNKKHHIQQSKHKYFCQSCKSKLTTINHYFCNKCEKLYCLKHRLPEQHTCKENKNQSCAFCQIM